jgi:hypothetical protein
VPTDVITAAAELAAEIAAVQTPPDVIAAMQARTWREPG